MKRIFRLLGPLLVLVVFVGAAWILYEALKKYSLRQILDAMEKISAGQILAAVGLTLISYVILVGYDFVATRFVGLRLPAWKIALGAFAGYAFSYNFGATLAGTTIRGRLYTAWNVPVLKIVELLIILGLTFWFGLFFLAGILFIVTPLEVRASLLEQVRLPGHLQLHVTITPFQFQMLGAVLLLIALVYIGISAFYHGRVRLWRWEIPVPPFRLTSYQYAIATADLLVASSVLYVLLPHGDGINFTKVVGVYILAYVAEVLSHVPSGIGLLELIIVGMLAGDRTELVPGILASVLLFRVIYRLAPLLIAAALMTLHELALSQYSLRKLIGAPNKLVPPILPQLLAFLVFAAGTLLLVAAVSSTPLNRMVWAQDVLPLPVVEVSHFLGALCGMVLLLIARGIQHRLKTSFWIAAGAMAAGILCSISKGFEFEEAGLLLLLLLLLLPFYPRFYRRASPFRQPLSVGALMAVVVALLCAIWFGLFTYKHVDFAPDMFWQFAFGSDAPRFLRAMGGATVLLAGYCLARFWRPALPPPALPTPAVRQAARRIVAASPESYAQLALLGDKSLLLDAEQTALLMYAVQGNSWVTMGDPIGPAAAHGDLIWRLSQLCEAGGGWPAFYHVRQDNLPLYVDLGLTALKLGEEARVPLERFSLEDPQRRGMRQTQERFRQEGCSYEIVAAAGVGPLIPQLKAVSDAWLAAKQAREKRFSLGFFSEDYLLQTPVAVVRQEGRLTAFANLWQSAGREELSTDLMRHRPDAPDWIMQYLYVELMLWGQGQGFRWFNLGMAPVFELDHPELMPIWNRVGTTVFRHGDDFYNFQGLRQYKEKFHPEWRPIYLAAPGGLTLSRTLTDIAALIGSGYPVPHEKTGR